jgi:hypothetical protein
MARNAFIVYLLNTPECHLKVKKIFDAVPVHTVPVHTVPVHTVPVHNVPVHSVPVHSVPLHNVPIPISGQHKMNLWDPHGKQAASSRTPV